MANLNSKSGTHLHNTACKSCDSSDACSVYEAPDGTHNAYCWSCSKSFPQWSMEATVEMWECEDSPEPFLCDSVGVWEADDPAEYQFGCAPNRKVSKMTAEFFGTRQSVDTNGTPVNIYYPYHKGSELVGYKVRKLPKEWTTHGDIKGTDLFGQHLFPDHGKQVIIVEGEEDALAVGEAFYQHYKKIWPVVSLSSATNIKSLLANLKWLKGYETVTLYLDQDEAGQQKVAEIAKAVGFGKVKIAKGSEKDASDQLLTSGYMGVCRAIWDASSYSPVGILNSTDLWEQVQEYNKIESIPYPKCLGGLNDKLKGMRKGEITLWTSGTGTGKSTILREIANHLIENTDEKIGIISLEESPAETARKMAGMALNRNPSNEEISLEDLKVGYDKVFGDDRVLVLDHAGAITDNSVIDQLEYMAAMGCKYLFVDHITILVSEGSNGLTGNEATDMIMNGLLKVSKQHNVWIGLISHLRKMQTSGKSFEDGVFPSLDDIRGSGSIKQISHDIIAFSRNTVANDNGERNTIRTRVLKSRYTGLTGNSGACSYNITTGRLVATTAEFNEGDF